MHDTAFQIGSLAMNIYADLRSDSILEVGSQAVNGSLRDSALPSTTYVGLDIEDGEGVDLVVEPGKPFPVEDGSFDFVMASSVLEHDPCFWMTFLEMCRAAKDGGYIYINAPSNGVVHRYPQDHWRFYPDCGKALAHWASTQRQPVMLVESFIANREKDIWNDFVAVFRKGPIKKVLPKVFLHEHVPSTNVITWKSKEIVNPSEQPEDIILLTQAEERARLAEEGLAKGAELRDSLVEETAQLKACLAKIEEERQQQLAEMDQIKGELNLRESELRQRQEEIEQTRSSLEQAQAEVAVLRAGEQAEKERLTREREQLEQEVRAIELKLDQTRAEMDQRLQVELKLREQAETMLASRKELHEREQAEKERLTREREQLEQEVRAIELKLDQTRAEMDQRLQVELKLREQAETMLASRRELHEREQAEKERLTREREQLEQEIRAIELKLDQTRADHSAEKEVLNTRLGERFTEIADLTGMLAKKEASERRSREQIGWLQEAACVLVNGSSTLKGRLLGLLPAAVYYKRQQRLLKRKGLFDGEAYLAAHPDVAADGVDPLRHYLRHGVAEDRHRG
jgi:SAM-dependent methyltransferase